MRAISHNCMKRKEGKEGQVEREMEGGRKEGWWKGMKEDGKDRGKSGGMEGERDGAKMAAHNKK